MSQPQGRPRGRARGRSRGGTPAATAPQQQVQRPGEPAPSRGAQATDNQVVPGRGRMRGGTAQPMPGAAPPHQAPVQPPVAAMAALTMQQRGGTGGATTRRRREFNFTEPATRPETLVTKEGAAGNVIKLYTNCFNMKFTDWVLYQYRVEFEPNIDFRRARAGIVRGLASNFHNEIYAFDGETLFALTKFSEQVTSFPCERRDGTSVTVTFLLTNELPPDSPQNIHVYNIILKKVLKLLKLEQVGRNYYNPHNPPTIPQHHLQLWPGYFTSIASYEEGRVMLMADVSHKILHTNTVLNFMYELYDRNQGTFQAEAQKKLIGEIVMTRYNNKTYRVDDISWDTKPTATFETRKGPITFVEYYQQQYEKTISDLDQPMLISRPKKKEAGGEDRGPIMLVPELCFLTGLMEETRSNFTVMKDIAVHTRVSPSSRAQTLQRFLSLINTDADVQKYLNQWQVTFEPNLTEISARILPPEKLFQRDQVYTYRPSEADWGREMRGFGLVNPIKLTHWHVIATKRDSNIMNDFINTMPKVGNPMGMSVGDPQRSILNDDRTDSYLTTIRRTQREEYQIVICILPSNRKDRYDSIKKCCIFECPIPSQVIVARTLSKRQMLMSVTTKVAMQLNCKMGGELWNLEIPMSNLMVIGIDTYHDSSVRGRSILGFVATMNKALSQYFSRCTTQDPGQEIADSLKVMTIAALKRYNQINKKMPERIIIYRDGVGDGQLPAVVEHEVPQVISAFEESQANYMPKFGFVVVKKRINNRFFMPSNGSGGGGGGRGGGGRGGGGRGGRPGPAGDDGSMQNPPPGTVVDSVVTKSQLYDFFLVSQSVRQGSVSPTSYNIIYDTTGLKPDHMQRLAYKLTHLYYNWPGTIRVPAPCLYAHKLAFLIGQSVHQIPGPELADTLYYL